MSPIWEAGDRGGGKMEVISTLNQTLMMGIPSCCRLFWGRAHFSTSLTLLTLIQNVSLWNPSLDPACNGGGGVNTMYYTQGGG